MNPTEHTENRHSTQRYVDACNKSFEAWVLVE